MTQTFQPKYKSPAALLKDQEAFEEEVILATYLFKIYANSPENYVLLFSRKLFAKYNTNGDGESDIMFVKGKLYPSYVHEFVHEIAFDIVRKKIKVTARSNGIYSYLDLAKRNEKAMTSEDIKKLFKNEYKLKGWSP